MKLNNKSLIIKAQNGDEVALAELIEKNNRANMEYCKKVYRKRS